MAKLLAILAFIAILSIAYSDDATPSMVVEVFRHGARGPIGDKFDKSWTNQYGQLTGVGMRQHYLLGVALRDKYKTLLDKYDPATIYVRSTDVNRTIMSAYSHLYGIYKDKGPGLESDEVAKNALPPYNSEIINQTAKTLSNDYALPNNLQVLPIHVQAASEDYVLRGPDMCPMTNKWVEEILKDDETKTVFEQDLADLTKYLTDGGMKIESISDLATLGDAAIADRFEGKDIPGNIDPKSQHYESVKFAAYWQFFKKLTSGKNSPALHSVLLFQEIQKYINDYFKGTSNLKFVFLSAHDSTLAPLLAALKVTTKDCLLENYREEKQGKPTPHPYCQYPIFASNLVFEFYNATETTEAAVAFYYDGVALPFCGQKESNKCTLTEFNNYIGEITNHYTRADFNSICQIPGPIVQEESKLIPILTGILAFIAVVLLIGVIGTYLKLKQKNDVLINKEARRISLVNNEA